MCRSEGRRSFIKKWLRGEQAFRWIPLIPAQVAILFLTTPILLLIYLAFTRWRVTRGAWWAGQFAGLHNFANALADQRYLEAFGRSLYFTSILVPSEILLGLGLAYLCYQPFKGRKFFSAVFLVPMMVVPVVIGYNSNMLFVRDGPINQILSLITFQDIKIDWLSNPRSAQLAVICSDIWQWTPLMFLIFVSGFSSIHKEPLNAAKVLGASTWQIFDALNPYTGNTPPLGNGLAPTPGEPNGGQGVPPTPAREMTWGRVKSVYGPR